jgi:hypothetical protein
MFPWGVGAVICGYDLHFRFCQLDNLSLIQSIFFLFLQLISWGKKEPRKSYPSFLQTTASHKKKTIRQAGPEGQLYHRG